MQQPPTSATGSTRATGINSRPVIGLYDDPAGGTHERLTAVTARAAERRRLR